MRRAMLLVPVLLSGAVVPLTADEVSAVVIEALTPVAPPTAVAPPDVIEVVESAGPTVVGGTLTVDTTWGLQGSPYIVESDLRVARGTSLTLLPGTVVKMLDSTVQVDGQLLVLGSPGSRVVFTSLYDDSVMGDTNGDGDATSPAPGDWKKILLYGQYAASSGVQDASVINYADFRYGGRPTATACRTGQIETLHPLTKLVVSNSTFSDSGDSHIFANGGTHTMLGVYNNTFSRGSGSDCGVRLWGQRAEFVSNLLSDVILWQTGSAQKVRAWWNFLGGGTYLTGNVNPYVTVPRENLDFRYNTVLQWATDFATVDWSSNWWGYDINPLPACMMLSFCLA